MFRHNNIADANSTSTEILEFTGHCETNNVLIGEDFVWYFQCSYNAIFVTCLVVVIALYIAIFCSVAARRQRKQRRKAAHVHIVAKHTGRPTNTSSVDANVMLAAASIVDEDGQMTAELTVLEYDNNGDAPSHAGPGAQAASSTPAGGCGPQAVHRGQQESTLLANLRTAAMLFVVTIVFIVTFTPGFLMTLELLPTNLFVFYIYFANNVANPFIYSFMNRNFRADLRRLICQRK